MRKVGCLFLAVLTVVLLAGCPAFFEFNLFKPLDFISLPTKEKLESMSGAEAFAYLSRELGSPSFIEKLRSDADARIAVEEYLAAQTGIPPMAKGISKQAGDIATIVEWWWLTAKYYLGVYFGEDLVNNVANLLTEELDAESFETDEDLQGFLVSFLESIVPAEALETQAKFYTMLAGFQRAWQGYKNIALTFDGDPATPDLPANLSMGDYIQCALFSWLVDTALTPDVVWATTDYAKAALWQIVKLEEPTQPLGTGLAFVDPFSPGQPIYLILSELGIMDLF